MHREFVKPNRIMDAAIKIKLRLGFVAPQDQTNPRLKSSLLFARQNERKKVQLASNS